jgi:peptidoglycan/LPS O-acetylase OafA/YrhL
VNLSSALRAAARHAAGYVPAMPPERLPGLDGLRAYAALIVISVHIFFFGDAAWGVTCVWAFFVISGFLLFRPFVENGFGLTGRDLGGYLVRRFFRIMPLYAVALGAYWAAGAPPYDGRPSWVLRHLTFANADGHLWTVKQEVLCYLGLPAIAAGCALLGSRVAALAFVLVLVPATYLAFDVGKVVVLTGGFAWMDVWATPFVCGMALAFAPGRVDTRWGLPLVAVGLLGAVALSVRQASTFEAFERLMGLPKDGSPFSHPWLVWPFVCALVLGIALRPTPIFANRAAYAIGVVSFGVYLWHQLVLQLLQRYAIVTSPWRSYVVGAAAAVALSAFTHRWIERPGMRLGHRLARRLGGAESALRGRSVAAARPDLQL